MAVVYRVDRFLPAAQRLSLIVEIVGVVVGKGTFGLLFVGVVVGKGTFDYFFLHYLIFEKRGRLGTFPLLASFIILKYQR